MLVTITTGTADRRAAKDDLYDGFTTIARALSSGRRAELIDLLAQGERTVDHLAVELDQSLANTSHHLRTLARAGLVLSRRAGTHVHYRLASAQVLELWWALRAVATARIEGLDELTTGYLGARAQIPIVSREEVLARLGTDRMVLIDVRPPAEYAAGHLPGAISVPPDRLERLDDLPAGCEVIAYCRGPYCVYADDAVRRLQQRGRRAARLADGLPAWRHAGGAVETGDGEVAESGAVDGGAAGGAG